MSFTLHDVCLLLIVSIICHHASIVSLDNRLNILGPNFDTKLWHKKSIITQKNNYNSKTFKKCI